MFKWRGVVKVLRVRRGQSAKGNDWAIAEVVELSDYEKLDVFCGDDVAEGWEGEVEVEFQKNGYRIGARMRVI